MSDAGSPKYRSPRPERPTNPPKLPPLPSGIIPHDVDEPELVPIEVPVTERTKRAIANAVRRFT